MPRVYFFDKGSKRRLSQIRWKLIEVFSLAMLAVLAFAVGILVMLGELEREHPYSEPTKVLQIMNAEPR